MVGSPISPSISARGTKAATESITTKSTAPERTNVSAISNACSPVSGCEISNSSIFTPQRAAYLGSSACSISMKAAVPPRFWHSATMCWQTVVLPEDSGPKISVIRPRGMPPTPNAKSKESEPVGMASTCIECASPKRMMLPSP